MQKALIKVDEKGTTAAAVVSMMAVPVAVMDLPQPEPFEMVCDSPFVFMLQGPNGVILFAGVVNCP